MTKKELKEFVFKATKTLIEKKCYIKGYGEKFRVMDAAHSPVYNISKREMDALWNNKIVHRDGLVYVLSVSESPFASWSDVKLE